MTVQTASRRWVEDGEALLGDMITLRRAIHAEPEIGLHTPKTTAKARQALEGLPLEFWLLYTLPLGANTVRSFAKPSMVVSARGPSSVSGRTGELRPTSRTARNAHAAAITPKAATSRIPLT